jgi:hypothetical protein
MRIHEVFGRLIGRKPQKKADTINQEEDVEDEEEYRDEFFVQFLNHKEPVGGDPSNTPTENEAEPPAEFAGRMGHQGTRRSEPTA